MRFHTASGTGPILALAPRPTAFGFRGNRTVGSAPARGTVGRALGWAGAAGFAGAAGEGAVVVAFGVDAGGVGATGFGVSDRATVVVEVVVLLVVAAAVVEEGLAA